MKEDSSLKRSWRELEIHQQEKWQKKNCHREKLNNSSVIELQEKNLQ
jgi:hypothetical protein